MEEVTSIPGSVAVLAFERDLGKAERIVLALSDGYSPQALLYEHERMGEILEQHDLIVGIMAVGILVRGLCPHLKDKWTDRPVVAVDSSLSCAVPIIGGHHGANDLARYLATRMGLFAAVTTATDSTGRPCLEEIQRLSGARLVNREASKAVNLAFLRKDVPVLRLKGPRIVLVDESVAVMKSKGLVVGIGARRGVSSSEVLEAVDRALLEAKRKREDIGILASASLKRDEAGLEEAARILERGIVFLSDEEINSQTPSTPSRASELGLVGVAEPAVLAIAERLILPKRAYGRVTVAIGE